MGVQKQRNLKHVHRTDAYARRLALAQELAHTSSTDGSVVAYKRKLAARDASSARGTLAHARQSTVTQWAPNAQFCAKIQLAVR